MARIRTIKPEFFTSEDIVSLTPLARLFYVSLWCESDRDGRLSWKLRTLKMRYLPGDDCDIQVLADELLSAGLVHLYVVDGCEYAYLPGFSKHQIINNREASSTLPAPPFAQVAQDLHVKHDASGTRESGDTHDAEGKGKEGKGKEGKGREEEGKDICQQADDLTAIFDYWCSVMNKRGTAKFTEDRKRAVKARMKEGYTAAHIMQAIDGCSRSDFHMARDGKNTTVYDDLAMICKSGSQLEKLAMNIGAGSMTSGILNGYQEFVGNE
jgi:hypothetical protein